MYKRNEREQMVPTLSYMTHFNRFMVHVQTVGELDKLNRGLQVSLEERIR
jgi:uncharacterized coiled-coil protein SlyX